MENDAPTATQTQPTETKPEVPKGYLEDANGLLWPIAKVKKIDLDRSYLVEDLCAKAKGLSASLLGFKLSAMAEVAEFVEKSLFEYDVKHGGKKGNVTLTSFDGRYKIVRRMQETIVFDERLQAAKLLIDDCILKWSKGSNINIKVLVKDAFQVDNTGNISAGKVLSLRRHKIEDPDWEKAMRAISDSISVAGTKPFILFYERMENGAYYPISLDAASV